MTMIQIDVANNLFNIILSILSILAVIVGVIAWFIRLESKVAYLEKDHEDNKTILFAKIDAMQSTLNDVLIGLGRLEGARRE